jgi:hypothetical protein
MSPTMMIMIYDLIIIILLLIILQNFDIFFFNVKNTYFEDLMKNKNSKNFLNLNSNNNKIKYYLISN